MKGIRLASLVIMLTAAAGGAAEWWQQVGTSSDIMNINGGKVGVGAAPDAGAKLDVAGAIQVGAPNSQAYIFDGAGSTGLMIEGTNPEYVRIKFNNRFQLTDAYGSPPVGYVLLHLTDYPSGGKLGIGTTAPIEKLHVVGNVRADGTVYATSGFRFPDGIVQVVAFDGNSLNAADGLPTDALFVDAEGRVGVGTTTPSQALHVIGAVYSTGTVQALGGFTFADGSVQQKAFDGHSLDGAGGTPIDAVYVDTAGSVGIGTTAPTEKLDVEGLINSWGLKFPDGTIQETAPTGDGHSLDAHDGYPRDVIYVDNLGRVGVGTTNPDQDAKLDVIGRTRTTELEITGGADLAEPFAFIDDTNIAPGMVASIDPMRPGMLRVSNDAYDRTVVGVISGAGGIKPGLLMGQEGSVASGHHPVALTGRVYALADASNGTIAPGDLLTTSNRAGHVMKVTDHPRAIGAILGKAMTGLDHGQGMVLMVVALQ